MTREETIKWLESLKAEIGKSEHRALWHYAEAVEMAIGALKREASDDLISRAEAIYKIHDFFSELMDKLPSTVDEDGDEVITDAKTANTLLVYNKMLCKRFDALPSADRPRGEWIEHDGTWLCSYCGEEDAYAFGKNKKQYDYFCPNCGADMRGEENE